MGILHPLRTRYRPIAVFLLVNSFVFSSILLYIAASVVLIISSYPD